MAGRRNQAHAAAIRVVLPYVAVSTLWLLLSDRAVRVVAGSAASSQWLQTGKGIAYVLLTAGVLYAICRGRFASVWATQRELRESERRFTALVGNLPGMAYQCLVDSGWTMLFVSRGAEALTGYRVEQLQHSGEVRFEDLIHPGDRAGVRAATEQAITEHRRFEVEYRLRTASGEERWVWEQGLPVFGPDGAVVALEGFIMDVTDRRAAQEIERERARLTESARAIEEAIGVVGHELRTPLASQRLLVETLLEGELAPGEREQYLRSVLAQTVRLTDMATNMLEAARTRGRNAVWRWERVRVLAVVESAAEVMDLLAAEARVEIATAVEPRELAVNGDPDGLRRLVLNLLSNAIKHAPGGTVRISASPAEDGRGVRLEVRDNGRGMPPDVLARLGQAFALNRGAVSSDPTAGVGLGLAICRRIAAVHGGTIEVASSPDSGTAFAVYLAADLVRPIAPAEPGPILRSAA